MSTAQHSTEHGIPNEEKTKHDDIWAEDMGDGHIGFRLADTTPPEAYDKLAAEFTDKIDTIKSRLEHQSEVTIGNATLERDESGCIEISEIESTLENHSVTWD